MGVTARRAKKKRAPEPVMYDDDDDDEEEEEEDDFVPGQDDDDDDEEGDFEGDEDEEENVDGILEGHLYYEEKDDALHYQGDTFHLTAVGHGSGSSDSKKSSSSDNPVVWNPLRDPPPSSKTVTYQMKGTIDNEDEKDKKKGDLPQRIFDVTWTVQAEGAPLPGHHDNSKKTGDDEEEEDGKQKASPKRPASFYHVVGREVVSKQENVLIQFQGGFYPPSNKTTDKVPLNCQFQYVIPETRASVAAAAAPIVAVAAARAAATDDDEEEDEADEGMGYDELIALHEDANVNVEELKRRYQEGDGKDDGKPSAKKLKPAPKEEDSDDDVGF